MFISQAINKRLMSLKVIDKVNLNILPLMKSKKKEIEIKKIIIIKYVSSVSCGK